MEEENSNSRTPEDKPAFNAKDQAKFDGLVATPPAPSEPIKQQEPSPVYPSAKTNPTFKTPEDRAAEDK
jgi:hypothetical protein